MEITGKYKKFIDKKRKKDCKHIILRSLLSELDITFIFLLFFNLFI